MVLSSQLLCNVAQQVNIQQRTFHVSEPFDAHYSYNGIMCQTGLSSHL